MSERRRRTRARACLAAATLLLAPSCLERRDEPVTDADVARCTACHGDANRAGDFLLRSAPPRDLLGTSAPSYPGVGAHALHLYASNTHAAFACNECHVVPERVDSPGHADDDRPAELVFGALAKSGGRAPHYDPVARTCADGWCHRDGADAVWTEPRTSAAACGTCHGLPPALPHPQSERCETCHGEVIDAQRHFVAPELHVDGTVQTQPGKCSACHGSGEQAAPPKDTHGNQATTAIGVGAHRAHLEGGQYSRALDCSECHQVPETADEPGHAEGLPARVLLSGVAANRGRTPSWNREQTSCAETWCHGPSLNEHNASPSWIGAKPSTCTSCHGLPPALPHPQSERCETCHGEVIDAQRHFVAPELHVDGTVQTQPGKCSACHGSGEQAAPPKDTHGNQATAAIGVGAHRAHLEGGQFSRPLDCAECHTVPETADEPGHAEGRPARVLLSGVATNDGRTPSWNREQTSCAETWCHGPSLNEHNASPSWIGADSSTCTSCHGSPPPLPHPQVSNCSNCHANVVGSDNLTIIDRARHVDGIVDVDVNPSCTSCHGTETPAPPKDTAGHDATTFAGVGAHQAHLETSGRARQVACAECHTVPEEPLSPGHIDSALPAELLFSGVATAFGAQPVYEGGTCNQTACHGAVFPQNHASGGSNVSPRWTQVDGSQATCGSCHGLPPPRPHPLPTNCSQCHEDLAADNVSFVHPELHVDGIVTFTVP